ncbi:MAG: ABC transporter permease [Mycoplasmoidaceae bacterium]
MTFDSIFNLTLLFSLVLGLGALSGYFSERVGIVNIGINGMMIFGALFYCIYGGLMNGSSVGDPEIGGNAGNWSFFIPMILAAASTILVGLLFGLATIKLHANHVVVGTAINLLGTSFGIFLTNSLGYSIIGAEELRNPYDPFLKIGDTVLFGSSILLFVLIGLGVLVLWFMMNYTRFGLRLKSIGENPYAADAQGINVNKYKWIGLIISSVLAGLAGAIFMYNTTSFRGDVDSLGFLSLAIMIAASWRIRLICLISFVFALLVAISKQQIPDFSSDILLLIPYAFSLVTLIVFSFFKFGSAPKFAGKHFILERT